MKLGHLVKQYIAVPTILLIICLYISFNNLEFSLNKFLTSAIVALSLYVPFKVLKFFFHQEYGRYPDSPIAHDRILIFLIILWILCFVISYYYWHDLDVSLGAGVLMGFVIGFTFEGVTGKSIF